MGYIKKLKNNELVGGTDKHTIYPVTSTKAVFEEVTEGDKSSFKSQETINKEQQNTLDAHNGRVTYLEDHAVKSVTINGGTKTYTVDDTGNVNLDVYTTESAEEQATLAEEVGDIRSIVGTKDSPASDTLVNRVGELETLVGGSGQGSVNTRIANAKAEILGDAAEDYNTLGKVEDKIQEEVARATAEETELSIYVHAIEGGNIRVKSSIPINPDTGAPANTVYRVAGTTTYSDYMWSGTTMVKMAEYNVDTLESQFGYYKWETASNTISITTNNQVAGSPIGSYVLTSGGSFKIKMTNKATGACTLNMNGTGVKTLLYNGDPIDSSNTWEEGEVISVYYDGSVYQASNAQGGSNKKIDAYLLGGLRTLAVGQTYEKEEAVKTTDKQLRRMTENVKALNLTDEISIGDLKYIASGTDAGTYKALKSISIFDESKPDYSSGDYAIKEGVVNIYNGSEWSAVSQISDYVADTSMWTSVDATWLSANATTQDTSIWLENKLFKGSSEVINYELAGYGFVKSNGRLNIYEEGGSAYRYSELIDVSDYKSLSVNRVYASSSILALAAYGENAASLSESSQVAITSKSIAGNGTRTVLAYTIPEGVRYIRITYNTQQITTKPVITAVRKGVIEKLDSTDSKLDSRLSTQEESTDKLNLNRLLSEKFPDLLIINPQQVDLSSLPTQNCGLAETEWYFYGSKSFHKAISVTPGEKIIVQGDSSHSYACWVINEYNPPYENADPVPLVPYVKQGKRFVINGYAVLTAPSSAAYLIIVTKDNNGTAHSWSVYRCDSCSPLHKYNITKLRYATWNIGHFSVGDSSSPTITSDMSAQMAVKYRKLLNNVSPDIIGICEYHNTFDTSGSDTASNIFKEYQYSQVGGRTGYPCNAVFWNKLRLMESYNLIYPERVQAHYMKHIAININGVEVHIGETHFDFQPQDDVNVRLLQINEAIADMANYDHVIISGDFNTSNAEDLVAFTEAGYTNVTADIVGNIPTHYNSDGTWTPIDYIMVKGFKAFNINVVDDSCWHGNAEEKTSTNPATRALSDHKMLYCDLILI